MCEQETNDAKVLWAEKSKGHAAFARVSKTEKGQDEAAAHEKTPKSKV